MAEVLHRALFAFLALFPILNPPAMAPIFLELTGHVDARQQHRLAALIGSYTFIFLGTILLVGGWILKLLGISIPVLAIAGGLLLFHSAWNMLNQKPRMTDRERADLEQQMLHRAFFPLTLPITAGPGAVAVTLSLVPTGKIYEPATMLAFLGTACGIALAALSVWIFYRFSGQFLKRLSATASATISQISAFVLLAIGVQIVWGGLRELIRGL